MKYYSLNSPDKFVDFREATIRGQAPDKGLYFPQEIPRLTSDLLTNLPQLSREEIAFRIIRPYTGDTLPESELHRIVAETINFDFPLVPVTAKIGSLELFHGPTLAFKDVGARFMSRCLGYFVKDSNRPVTVLVATSGDTGGAVASGFYDIPGIRVIILYPSGKVSSVQELQLTTLGKNITALEVEGSFDDCQRMVKEAFADPTLQDRLFLTSANSINVARWLPQQFYYFFAAQQWPDPTHPPVISVPSGNFGNICAGLLAHRSGLPVRHFIAACNANDIVPAYLQTGDYRPKPALPTLSNAMDVGNPSNFVRILELFHQKLPNLQQTLSAVSISDKETIDTIRDLYTHHHYLPDPHGAVGYLALERYLVDHPNEKGIFLETAHPVKFYDVVEPVIGSRIPLPESVKVLLNQAKNSIRLDPVYAQLKDFLLS
ncbi:MAG TPA: threonine synthase [Puia sp.]|jgi:threonine synthase|nr:threonine synthase [Puia sp.]